MLSISSAPASSSRKRLAIIAAAFSLTIVATLAICIFRYGGASAALAGFTRLHFSYHEVDEWPGECQSGRGQMPVDLNTQKALFQPRQPLHWTNLLSKRILTALAAKSPSSGDASGEDVILFNGHTIEVNPAASPVINYEGKNYQLLQFHFHTPSENRIDGHASASEMHMVHRASDGSLLVFGIMLDIDHKELEDATLSPEGSEEGSPDAAESPLYPVFQALPVLAHRVFHSLQEAKPSHVDAAPHAAAHEAIEMPLLGFSIEKLTDFLKNNDFSSNYYFLPGSLTTPPCTEGVHWVISAKHMTIPGSALTLLMQMEGMNSRVIQSYNTRVLHKNFK